MLQITSSKFGWAKLSDGTRLSYRVAILTVKTVPGTESRPIGPLFRVGTIAHVTVEYCPEELREKVKDKPPFKLEPSVLTNSELWEVVEVLEYEPARETCLYQARDGRVYSITTEIEPTIVARTLHFRDEYGNPVYFVRWARKDTVKLAGERLLREYLLSGSGHTGSSVQALPPPLQRQEDQ